MTSTYLARKIFLTALESVKPEQLIQKAVRCQGNTLTVNGREYLLNKNVFVVGFGKAVYGMCVGVQNILKHHIVGGCLSVPHGTPSKDANILDSTSNISVKFGAQNNFPDFDAMQNATDIRNIITSLHPDDIGIVLISGGGSALLPLPVPEVSLDDKIESIKAVAKAGGNIKQLNLMRQKISQTKGGKLLSGCSCTNMISLIISDIVGDPLDLIASGPTVANTSTVEDCLTMFGELKVENDISKSVLNYLKSTSSLDTRQNFQSCNNVIIGSNTMLVNRACEVAVELGHKPFVITTQLEADATHSGRIFAELAVKLSQSNAPETTRLMRELNDDNQDADRGIFNCEKICLIMSGETTVKVAGNGRGGRNQHFILSALCRWKEMSAEQCIDFNKICLLSAGTDGQDGATDATGAVCDGDMLDRILSMDLDVHGYLSNSASYDFFTDHPSLNGLIKTGLTGTNVMDIHLALIDKTQGFD